MIPLLGLIIGLVIGFFINVDIPQVYAPYIAILVLAMLCSLTGAAKASLKGEFNTRSFLAGLTMNSIFALVLTSIGEQLKMPLSYAAIFAFGHQMYYHLVIIRKLLLEYYDKKRLERAQEEGGGDSEPEADDSL
ncbi:MAG: DUF1290 domain-containing protein [Clostridiaceae bacterium]|nr:DUF1290 domain-containing protein [Clostridiaceae bacterium]